MKADCLARPSAEARYELASVQRRRRLQRLVDDRHRRDRQRRLRGARLLQGFRGEKPRDVTALADAAARIGALMLATPDLDDIDVNPLIVLAEGEGVVAVDALFISN